MVNEKAQSALEYLMTYGWALIVIIIAIAAAVTLIPKAPPSCTGFQKLVITNYNLTSNGLGIAITNGTGRTISNSNFNAIFVMNENQVADVNYNAGNVSQGALINLNFNPGTTLTGEIRVNITATYFDGDFNRIEKASCVGSL
ncbi:MAG: hypothetical protein QXU92_04105 [Candidatus Diapherotrites archaeon]